MTFEPTVKSKFGVERLRLNYDVHGHELKRYQGQKDFGKGGWIGTQILKI